MKLVSNSPPSTGRNTPLLLLAASGMGKSTLLAQVVGSIRKGRHYDVLHSVFVGSVERSSDALAVGRALCVALSRDLAAAAESGAHAAERGDALELPTDLQGICAMLESLLGALSKLDRKVMLGESLWTDGDAGRGCFSLLLHEPARSLSAARERHRRLNPKP